MIVDQEATRSERIARTIALLLQRRKMTARQLAAHFEVNPRTVWRDMKVITNAGLPVLAIPGRGYLWHATQPGEKTC